MRKFTKWIPRPLKNAILWVVRLPGKLHAALFQAAMRGTLYCPDKLFLKWNYRVFMHRKLDLRHPKTFNEKLQWLKYYYRNPAHTPLADKYAVRAFVAERLGDAVLIPCYGVYDSWDAIDFDALPQKFVIKCTHDSGSVVIVRDKETFDRASARRKIEAGLSRNQFYLSREWVYKNIKPRILIEAFLEVPETTRVPDYKCMCFGGKMHYTYVCSDREAADGAKLDFFDMEWNHLAVSHVFPNSAVPPAKPACFETMVQYAETLAADMPFVRVDFYEVDGKLYFGEITFFPSGGRMPYEPESFDLEMGEKIVLPMPMR